MRVYIASRLENVENVKHVQRAITRIGWELTYDWTTHGSVGHLGQERVAEVCKLESRAVETAHLVIVLLPGGRGTHAELGIALALGTPTIVHHEDDSMFECTANGTPCAFYFSRFVTRVVSPLEWLTNNLGSLAERARHANQPANECIIDRLHVRD